MVVADEAHLLCLGAERRFQLLFERRRQGHVEDHATLVTNQVMVVLPGNHLGQFEPSMVVRGSNALHHASLFQDREVPVGRTLRKARFCGQDTGDGQRTARPMQDLDKLPSIGRIALRGDSQAGGSQGMNVVGVRMGGGSHQSEVSARSSD